MDGNKDDAERCLQLASSALAAGDIPKATRLLEKSRRMYPLPNSQNRLSEAIHSAKPNQSSSKSRSPSPAAKPSREPQTEQEPNGPPREPTPEMIAAVRSIQKLREKSHYDVLSLARDCDETAIKKAYRKLALRLHPDRNFAPAADEAFKRVSQAFMTLSDPKRRAYYDRTGADEPGQLPPPPPNMRRRRGRGRAQSRHGPHYEYFDVNDLTAEELFEFLFSQNAGGNATFRTATPQQFETRAPSFWERFKPIILMFLFILLTMVLSDNNSAPSYSLHRTPYHAVQRSTRNDIKYFVPRSLHMSIRDQRSLERDVDVTALEDYKLRCAEEVKRASFLLRQSQRWFISSEARTKYRKQFEEYEKPWCKKTQQLHAMLRQRW